MVYTIYPITPYPSLKWTIWQTYLLQSLYKVSPFGETIIIVDAESYSLLRPVAC
jgi:hypothetical protein